jgi:hypothetical protein
VGAAGGGRGGGLCSSQIYDFSAEINMYFYPRDINRPIFFLSRIFDIGYY